MATTSGTIGQTTLTVAQLLEHAYRRCGVTPSKLTPEDEQSARESLFMLIISLASRGVNLWCVEKNILGLAANQALYVLPDGTLDVLNWIHSHPSQATGTDTLGANSVSTDLGDATSIVRYGFKPSANFTGTAVLSGSSDGVTWTALNTQASDTWVSGTWYWFDLDPVPEYRYFQLSTSAVAATFTEFYLASSVRDIKISPWNRDDWANQPNKTRTGTPATNVYFEKLVTPQFTLWPVPSSSYDQVSIWRHRQIQDVGDLTNSLELPTRWFEEIVWQLSVRVASEVPGADGRLQFVTQMADKYQIEAEMDETDGSPIYLQPNIRGYTA